MDKEADKGFVAAYFNTCIHCIFSFITINYQWVDSIHILRIYPSYHQFRIVVIIEDYKRKSMV